MEPRLASHVLVGALIRLAESQGGFAAVLAKGDREAGAITVILAERGGKLRILEQLLQSDGSYLWQQIQSEAAENEGNLNKFLARRRKIDPDMWAIELNIASAERFAAEMNGFD
jgi:hypothetical protein